MPLNGHVRPFLMNDIILRMRFSINICALLVACLAIGVRAQNLSKEQIVSLVASVAEDEKAVTQCVQRSREFQIKKFGKPLPRISGHCWDGCPTSMPKPYYPEVARRNPIKGEVIVTAIVDEVGKVVYARAVKGPTILRAPAVEAAYHSSHSRKMACDRPIKFWWRIRYYFHPER